MSNYIINHLKELESEAIFVIREVAAQFENPVLLFSGGKDSIVLTRLAKKAFYPAQIPFKLLHVDTGHNFPETLEFRDNLISEMNLDLVVGYVQDSINKDPSIEEKGANASRNSIQTITLLEMIDKYNFPPSSGEINFTVNDVIDSLKKIKTVFSGNFDELDGLSYFD